ncbi:hypothetical protein Rt10032_c09g3871 [Rhodotorula toruloides]|uniref:DUF4211 domain-containing protein n=1 Tax=Rhodotorula toruloides TaxID=5286 RepID=A0A511KK62_RHOTO|nr:hypothetical protein Rt10032_c09g3871 [Rhodotorula toruloides]
MKQKALSLTQDGSVTISGKSSEWRYGSYRSPFSDSQKRADRLKLAQRSAEKHHKSSWVEQKENGTIVDNGQEVGEDEDEPELEDRVELVSDGGEDTQSQDSTSQEEESESQQVRLPSSPSRPKATPRITLSSDEEDECENTPKAPVASTSAAAAKPPPSSLGRLSNRLASPAKRDRSPSVFEGVIIYVDPKRRPAGSSTKDKAPARMLTPVQLDDDDSSSDNVVVSPRGKGKGKTATQPKGKKRARTPSTSSAASLPLPASIAASNKRIRSQREDRLNKGALRDSGKKGKDGKRRKLLALSQGVRDRWSADEDSEGFDFVVDDEVVEYDTPTDEDEEERGKRRARNARMRAKGKGKERAMESDGDGAADESDDDGAADESDESAHRRRRKGKGKAVSRKSRKAIQRELLASDSENDDITGVSAKSRARQKAKARKDAESSKEKKRRHDPESGQGEEDEDMDDLEILDEQTVFEERFRSRRSGAGKFASLKAARDQKQAKSKAIVLDSADEAPLPIPPIQFRTKRSSPRFMGDTEHATSSESSAESSDVSESGSSSSSGDSFIVDEENPEDEKFVEEFRESIRSKMQGLRYYLKTYLLYLIHLAIDPTRDWLTEDEDFRMAVHRVDEHLAGHLNSLVTSSAWKPSFRKALEARPSMDMEELDKDSKGDPCEACSMGKARHSFYLFTVSGPKYDRKTLQPIPRCDDSSESDTDDDVPLEKAVEFKLGKMCAARAEVAHILRHWAYTTKERVVDRMTSLRRPIRRAKITEDMPTQQRKRARQEERDRKLEEATRIADKLDKDGVITTLVNKLDNELSDAVNALATSK